MFQLFQEQLFTIEKGCCFPRMVGILPVNLYGKKLLQITANSLIEFTPFENLYILNRTERCYEYKVACNKKEIINPSLTFISNNDYISRFAV